MSTNGKHSWGKDKNNAGYQAYTIMHTNPLGRVGGRDLPDLDWSALDPLGINEATAKHVRERFSRLSKRQKNKFFAIMARTSPQAVAVRLDIFIEAMALAREEGNEEWQQIVADVLGPIAKKELELNVIRDILTLQIVEAGKKRDKSRRSSTDIRDEEILDLRLRGKTQAEIAKKLGLSRSQVGRTLASHRKRPVEPTAPKTRKEVRYVERLVSDPVYREGYQDALKEPSRGLKQRFVKVLEKRPDIATDILRGRYVVTRNGKTKIDIAAAEQVAGIRRPKTGEAATLEKRLAEQAPEFLERYRNGEFSSIRKAAIAAGVHNDSHSAIRRLKSSWKRASAKERREFKRWLDANESH